MSQHQHIYLTGYRGAGKTSVGRILAQALEMPLVDLDDEVEAAAGKSIREIFSDDGEAAFRDWESQVLRRVAGQPAAVIALGGGAVLRPENRNCIDRTGVCIWLKADPESLVRRMRQDASTRQRRPALTSLPEADEVRQMMSERAPIYRQVADHCVETEGHSVEWVSREILSFLSQRPPA